MRTVLCMSQNPDDEPPPEAPRGVSQAAADQFESYLKTTMGYSTEAVYADEPPTSLCQAGPCRNYFRAVVVQEIQGNMDGTPVKPLLGTLTACYPHAGIEIDDIPDTVLECTRHDPVNLIGVSEIKQALQAWRERQRQRSVSPLADHTF